MPVIVDSVELIRRCGQFMLNSTVEFEIRKQGEQSCLVLRSNGVMNSPLFARFGPEITPGECATTATALVLTVDLVLALHLLAATSPTCPIPVTVSVNDRVNVIFEIAAGKRKLPCYRDLGSPLTLSLVERAEREDPKFALDRWEN